ncbi:MAG TPA: protein-glutamate O-methyltransferase CheR [Kofleriaceae bacterium]|nr:protein-glutamate O-methyltransferase CheR [Kofleriaceae bacterium]
MPEDVADFELVLQELVRHRGIDFRAYRSASLARRVSRRMDQVGSGTYARRLRDDTDEYGALCTEFPVNHTTFFRNPGCWTHLAATILPAMIQRRADGQLRAWTAGCSTGQEAYTVAMLLAEAVGPDRLPAAPPIGSSAAIRCRRDHRPFTVFATDVSDAAIRTAARGTYSEEHAASIPLAIRDRYLTRVAGEYRVTASLRACVVFGRHDLLHDVPLPSIDLVTCRNVMMYFTPEAQRRVLTSFAFALSSRDHGALLVGAHERPSVWSDRFRAAPGHHGFYSSLRLPA